ncbi:hypothetical protein EVJ58_g3299 [Rhodofomes roseus]|uniref:Fungal-type protein kinase domain-containing protein n=1 Tax=Rhodofomes roseus TaxID=34475 RepID=A0A4Y9YNW1_9APHY|nr:hypothetical protein EVJ58_g3299 [Rhodofomes roseus]
MAQPTPRQMKSRVYTIIQADALQSSEVNKHGWRSEVEGKIVEMDIDIELFLSYFMPSVAEMPPSQAADPFHVPVGGKETDMYKPLCDGLEKLVKDFPKQKRLSFHNNAHEEIKFPFLLCQRDQHATKPDVVASLPGRTFAPRNKDDDHDRWRDISVVFEIKNVESEDPMLYCSERNDETLVQLSKSARNILVSQSRLCAFAVGVYGSTARIFRFDHAGAVCTRSFKYGEDNGAVLYEFLWRLVHPIREGCDIVGADPTVRFASRGVTRALRKADVEVTSETRKACRWVTIDPAENQPAKKYLVYELLFINPRLFSRATTIWKALELDDDGEPTGTHVVIKESWRQLARDAELLHWKRIRAHVAPHLLPTDMDSEQWDQAAEEAFMEVWNAEWRGLAAFSLGADLGEDEELRADVEAPVGHRTWTGVHQCHGAHQWFERSHMRLVSTTIGTPISQFRRTREMVQVLRDAIYGHQLAFEAGVIQRDVSEGNVMSVDGRGFLHDLDYGFNWKATLYALGYEDTIESWEEFARTGKGKPREGVDGRAPAAEHAQQAQGTKEKTVPPPPSGYKPTGHRGVLCGCGHRGAEDGGGQENVRGCVAFSHWLSLPREDRKQLSAQHANDAVGTGEPPRGVRPNAVTTDVGTADPEKIRDECKQRTGTFLFMAIEVLWGGVVHQVRHDLESFFWLLFWLVLRHCKHDRHKYNTLKSFMDAPDEALSADHKMGWLRKPFTVPGNEPLNELLRRFMLLCDNNFVTLRQPEVLDPMTYQKVLQIFDDALARNDWPVDDKAIPWVPAQGVDGVPARQARPKDTVTGSQIESRARQSLGRPNPAPDANNAPRTPHTASSGSRPPEDSWTRPVAQIHREDIPDPVSPTPPSQRASSSHSAALPAALFRFTPAHDASRSPSPPWDPRGEDLMASLHAISPDFRSPPSHPPNSSAGEPEPSTSTQAGQGDASGDARHRGRKRSKEDLGVDDDLDVGPSKRSRPDSEQSKLLPQASWKLRPTPPRKR